MVIEPIRKGAGFAGAVVSVAVLIAAECAARDAAEQIRGGRAVSIERCEEIVPVLVVREAGGLANGRDRFRAMGFQFALARTADEGRGVAAMRPPLLLLPARKAGRALCDMRHDMIRYGLRGTATTDAILIRERGIELPMSGAVVDTPWTQRFGQFLFRIDGAGVDPAPRSTAALALRIRWGDASGCDRIGVVFEYGKFHGRSVTDSG